MVIKTTGKVVESYKYKPYEHTKPYAYTPSYKVSEAWEMYDGADALFDDPYGTGYELEQWQVDEITEFYIEIYSDVPDPNMIALAIQHESEDYVFQCYGNGGLEVWYDLFEMDEEFYAEQLAMFETDSEPAGKSKVTSLGGLESNNFNRMKLGEMNDREWAVYESLLSSGKDRN